MSAWADVALVLAGSTGPAAIAVVTIKSDRRKERVTWLRGESARRHDIYATFLAASSTVVADWSDVVLMPPRSVEEARVYDERRDVHYDQLNMAAAMVRLTAVPTVAEAAEGLLAVVREAQARAVELATTEDRAVASAAWQPFAERYAEARRTFISAARSCDIRPPDDA